MSWNDSVPGGRSYLMHSHVPIDPHTVLQLHLLMLRHSRGRALPSGTLLAALPPPSVHWESELLHFASAGWSDPYGGGGVLY